MVKKFSKPNLGTLESAIMLNGYWEGAHSRVEYKRSTGMYLVTKDGQTRLYSDLRDAWKAC